MSTILPNEPNRLSSRPPEAWEPLVRIARFARWPLERFLRIEAASGIVLLVAAVVALVAANSPWRNAYEHVWAAPIAVRVGGWSFERSVVWVVNDVLMVIFFFFVGLEIRRELDHGELSEWRRAALPAAAALGGMLVPAGIYLAVAGHPPTRAGWGVPMATDIAFAVGVLTLLGRRVPAALRVLLLALAVIDDLGAIVVIALFYSSGVALGGLLVAAFGIAGIFLMQRFGVRTKAAYVLPGAVVWAGAYAAGIHPTIAGVVVGLVTPVRAWLGPEGFLVDVREELDGIARSTPSLTPHGLAEHLRHVDLARREAMSPAESLIETLHPFVAFGIMPLFALANAGVSLRGASLDATSWRIAIGAGLGLVVGKPIGVSMGVGAALALRVGVLPRGLGARHVFVLGLVAGIGFTMALFVAQLAFSDAAMLSAAKLGVLGATGVASLGALLAGRALLSTSRARGEAATADEAERSTEALRGVRMRTGERSHDLSMRAREDRAPDPLFAASHARRGAMTLRRAEVARNRDEPQVEIVSSPASTAGRTVHVIRSPKHG